MKRPGFVPFLLLSIASCAKPTGPEIKDAWARDTVGGSANAAVFMTISSKKPDRLIAASTPVAKKTDLMTMGPGGSVMGMKYVKGIVIPGSVPVNLNPAGLHVWLAELNEPLRAGHSFPISLRFERAGERVVTVSVIEPTAAPPGPGD